MLTIRRDKRFIQIWVLPEVAGLDPEVEQKAFTKQDRSGRLLRVMGPDGAEAPSELILVDVPTAFRPVGIWAGQDG
jgi:hypothetical protein